MLPVLTYVTNGTITDKESLCNDSNRGSTSPGAIYFLMNYVDGLELRIIDLKKCIHVIAMG